MKGRDGVSLNVRILCWLSVALVGALFGVPYWMYATSIERSQLPNVTLESLGGVNYYIPVYLIDVPEPLYGLVRETNDRIQELSPKFANEDIQFNLTLKLDAQTTDLDINDSDVRYKAQLILTETGEERFAVSSGPDRLIKIYVTENIISNDKVPEFVARVLVDHVFKEEIEKLQHRIQNIEGKSEEQEIITINYHPKIKVSLNLLRADGSDLTWDLESNAFKKFQLFVRLLELNGFASFEIEVQEDWYEKKVSTPNEYYNEAGQLIIKDTSTFIDYSGWSLDQNVGIEPVINLVIYVPKAGEELIIENSGSNSFIVPQWGGLLVENNVSSDGLISEERMSEILDIFSSQLFQLVGGSTSFGKSIYYRIDELVRLQFIDNCLKSIDNIKSLDKLTQQLQSIPIPNETVEEIFNAIEHLKSSLDNIGVVDNWWVQSTPLSGTAFQLSDKAFFQKDMVQQAHFPDEHKTAVYSPLLGPFAAILLMGVMRLFKEWKEQKKEKKEKEL